MAVACGVSEHEVIIETLIAGDAATAARLMDAHLEHVADRALLEPKAARASVRDVLSSYAARLKEIGRA